MVFVPKGTVVATYSRFVKILCFCVDNTCQALLVDQMESSDIAEWFGKLSTKEYHQNFKKPTNIQKMQLQLAD